MKHRSPIAVFFLPLITLGIYSIVWEVKTKGEMNRLGANIPTAWLIIIPFVSIYWVWKYSEGVEKVTGNKLSTPLAFVILFFLGVIGMAIVQSEFNKVGAAPADAPFNPNNGGNTAPMGPSEAAAPQSPAFSQPTVVQPNADVPAPTPANNGPQDTTTPPQPPVTQG